MNKIIIFGFPHCGTTILKSIIGHIDEVQEINSLEDEEKNNVKNLLECKKIYQRSFFFIKYFIIKKILLYKSILCIFIIK